MLSFSTRCKETQSGSHTRSVYTFSLHCWSKLLNLINSYSFSLNPIKISIHSLLLCCRYDCKIVALAHSYNICLGNICWRTDGLEFWSQYVAVSYAASALTVGRNDSNPTFGLKLLITLLLLFDGSVTSTRNIRCVVDFTISHQFHFSTVSKSSCSVCKEYGLQNIKSEWKILKNSNLNSKSPYVAVGVDAEILKNRYDWSLIFVMYLYNVSITVQRGGRKTTTTHSFISEL